MAYGGSGGFLARGLPPTGLAALLARPGLRDALLATGSALLQQRDVPGGSLAAGLGRALPVGVQAFQQGKQKAEFEQLLGSAPPEMRQLLGMLGPERGIPALLQMMAPKEPEEYTLGPGDVRFRGGDQVAAVPAEVDTPELPADVRTALFTLFGSEAPENLTPEQLTAVTERMKELAQAGAVNLGAGDVSKLPTAVQAGIVGAQGVRDALDRFEGYAKSWLDLPTGERVASKAGGSNENDALLGNLNSVRQELVLNLKNLAELGVLAGPDMAILDAMIGDPTSWAAMLRSPEFSLTRINRVREFVESKIRNYERTYNIDLPDAAPRPAPAPNDPLGIRRP